MAPEEGTPDFEEQVDGMVHAILMSGESNLTKGMSFYLKDPEVSRRAIRIAIQRLKTEHGY